jgi:L-lactate dehydrogenase complex protein LldG
MSDARSEILARIAAALVDDPAEVVIPRDYDRSLPPALSLVRLFAERVADYRATVHHAGAAELPRVIAQVLASRGIGRLVVPSGLPVGWLAATRDLELVRDDPPLSVSALDAVDGVITDCAIAIADTGTIVLDAGPGQGRRALSLLPDRLVCIVDVARIVGSVPQALERLDPRRPITWISGPSATSDIELQRVEGVHGPRVLDVVIVAGAG